MRNQPIEKLQPLLQSTKRVVIIPHKNPDGDAMGSTLGLCHYLTQMNHSCTVISPNGYPDFLKWLPGDAAVRQFDESPSECEKLIKAADLIFTLDFNSFSRTGLMRTSLLEARNRNNSLFVMIDHHEQPEDYADFIYSVPEASSTCELVYNFILKFGGLDAINPAIATCLYTGIMTDTGSFKFSSTTSQTHRAVANLIERGAVHSKIHELIYDTKSLNQLQLLGTALNNLRLIPEKQTAYISLSQEELDRHHFKKGDTEGIVNYGLSLKGVIFAVIFIEQKKEGIIKISLRSKGDFDVNQLARKYFYGGGHINAAGGRSLKSLAETTQYLEQILNDYKILDSNAD